MGTEIHAAGQAATFASFTADAQPKQHAFASPHRPEQVMQDYPGSNATRANGPVSEAAQQRAAEGAMADALHDTARLDADTLEQVASTLSDMLDLTRKGLDFRVDEVEGLPVVSVMDIETGELIRQIPTEEALALAEKMSEIAGLLMKTEA
ncbi:MAG: flagellar protein FlaG [Shewanella sp.]